MIDPKAEPIGHRPPYKPIDVSGRKPVQQPPTAYEAWLAHFNQQEPLFLSTNWRELARIAVIEVDTK